MNINESNNLILNDNENETQGLVTIENSHDRYDKLNFKYFVIAFLLILFSLVNLSFYYVNTFTFVGENDQYYNRNENEGN